MGYHKTSQSDYHKDRRSISMARGLCQRCHKEKVTVVDGVQRSNCKKCQQKSYRWRRDNLDKVRPKMMIYNRRYRQKKRMKLNDSRSS